MKKGIFAMFILVVSMAMVACTSANKSTTNEGAVGENDAFKALEKRREYYKAQDKEKAKLEAEAKKVEEKASELTAKAIDHAQEAVQDIREKAEVVKETAVELAEQTKEKAIDLAEQAKDKFKQ